MESNLVSSRSFARPSFEFTGVLVCETLDATPIVYYPVVLNELLVS